MYSVIILFSFLLPCVVASTENETLTTITIGETTFYGTVMKTWKGNPFNAFRGIRFAKAPIGEWRFKDPRPIDRYAPGVYNATGDQHDCPSIYATNPDEDCLFLNVYVQAKSVLSNESFTMRPVIAFIHPGGFYVGSSLSSNLGPEYLLEKNIILVTFNYRLGALGFLNLGTEDIPGNAGLKDQVLALRWIKEYISYFGGDPNYVTLMGYSAGAFSATLHLISPMSQRLFSTAIIMSGSIPPQTILPSEQTKLAARQARVLGCTTDNTPNKILECLNSFNGIEIAFTLRKMFDFGKDNPIFLWLPVIEKDFGQERFLIENPYKSLKEGRFNHVPIMTGFTKNELCTSAVEILTNTSLRNELNNRFDHLAPICFMYPSENSKNITDSIKDHYNLPVGSLNESHIQQLCNIFSDAVIRFGTHRFIEIASEFTTILTYKFSYTGRYSNLFYPENHIFGVEHMDDLLYVFSSCSKMFSPEDYESRTVEIATDMIFNFSIFQMWKHFPGSTSHKTLEETIAKNDYFDYFEITDLPKLIHRNGTIFEEHAFWNNLDFSYSER